MSNSRLELNGPARGLGKGAEQGVSSLAARNLGLLLSPIYWARVNAGSINLAKEHFTTELPEVATR